MWRRRLTASHSRATPRRCVELSAERCHADQRSITPISRSSTSANWKSFQAEDSGAELWRAYRSFAPAWPNFAQTRIARPQDIFPVFRELFAKNKREAA